MNPFRLRPLCIVLLAACASGSDDKTGDDTDTTVGDTDSTGDTDTVTDTDTVIDTDVDTDIVTDTDIDLTPKVVAYAWGFDAAAADPYSPSATYSYNADGGDITITRTGNGLYDVDFEGLSLDGGIAMVSQYAGAGGGICHWSETTGSVVGVRCANTAGSNTDAQFVLTVFDASSSSSSSILGFAYANDSASASYTPQGTRSDNGAGDGTITATRSAAGTYRMAFGGYGENDIASAQVTAYNRADGHCLVQSYLDANVNVRCYDESGTLTDMPYLVAIFGEKAGATAQVVAQALAYDEAASSYTPENVYNEGGGAVSATRTEAGTYAVAFEGSSLNSGAHVQVNAFGEGRQCNVAAWAGDTVNITCTNSSGSLTDSPYAVTVFQTVN